MPQLFEVILPKRDEHSGETLTVLLEPVGDHVYRFVEHPLLAEGIGLDDLVKMKHHADGKLEVQRIVQRGSYRTLCFIVTTALANSPEVAGLLADAYAEGCQWDRALGGGVWIHVPRGRYPASVRRLIRLLRPPPGVCRSVVH